MCKKYGIQRLDTMRFLPKPFRYNTRDEALKARNYLQKMLYDIELFTGNNVNMLCDITPRLVIALVDQED